MRKILAFTGSAIAGEDYEMTMMDFTFPMTSMDGATQCLDVMIMNDGLFLEGVKTFDVTLTLLTTGLGVTTGNDTTRVIITGNVTHSVGATEYCLLRSHRAHSITAHNNTSV